MLSYVPQITDEDDVMYFFSFINLELIWEVGIMTVDKREEG